MSLAPITAANLARVQGSGGEADRPARRLPGRRPRLRRLGPGPDEWQLVALEQHIDDADELVEALADAEIVVAMRERTPFPAAILDRLPDLKLLITTGMGNAAIDVAAAQANGVTSAAPASRARRPPSSAGA